jgi:hypothetical protein
VAGTAGLTIDGAAADTFAAAGDVLAAVSSFAPPQPASSNSVTAPASSVVSGEMG